MTETIRLVSAWIQSSTEIEVILTPHQTTVASDAFDVPGLDILSVSRTGDAYLLKTSAVDIRVPLRVTVEGIGEKTVLAGRILDSVRSAKPLGCFVEAKFTIFRLFAPRAGRVQVVIFKQRMDRDGTVIEMKQDSDGVWEASVGENCAGQYYVYRLNGRQPTTATSPYSEMDVADPYSRSVARVNHYLHPSRTHIPEDDNFDWEGDSYICPALKDLIIYEMHVRDITVHESSGISALKRGTYSGLTEGGKKGGIDYIRSLGVNAVELLPVQEFANLEAPYRDLSCPVWNTWNPTARNHWGYMTSFFFAPESYYATGGNLNPGAVCGGENHVITEFKQMVKTFHQAGIAVILDVVYNHASQYDLNPLKQIDRDYYFRLNADGSFMSKSYCGNDLYTERAMMRRMITDSLVVWMREYHIDGFRFDLAGLLDDETLDAITRETRKVNPDVILIAEPWGGDRYGQHRFSIRGWGAWNDAFRNGIKGQNPVDGRSVLFGSVYGETHAYTLMKRVISGSPQCLGGAFVTSETSVNYLESHDEWTLGDFVRVATGETPPDTRIKNPREHIRLSVLQEKIHALAAVILMTSQGAVMLHAGQEFARSQVIDPDNKNDPDHGLMDHNSYNRDDSTNHIHYGLASENEWLIDYYRGLIHLRNAFPGLRETRPEALHFMHGSNPFSLGYLVRDPGGSALLVLLNASPRERSHFYLPEGNWSLIVSPKRSGSVPIEKDLSGRYELSPVEAVVLMAQDEMKSG